MAFLDPSTPNFIVFFQSLISQVNLSKISDHPMGCAIPVGPTLFSLQNSWVKLYRNSKPNANIAKYHKGNISPLWKEKEK